MKRAKTELIVNKIYNNNGGGTYKCLAVDGFNAWMENTKSGWTCYCHGTGIYTDGTIDWDYSTGGYFKNEL